MQAYSTRIHASTQHTHAHTYTQALLHANETKYKEALQYQQEAADIQVPELQAHRPAVGHAVGHGPCYRPMDYTTPYAPWGYRP